jgi:DNA-binding response OmpR family regulator
MAEERNRSLLLLHVEADERRLISAIAARAGWSVVGAPDGDAAVALLQGPQGREVQAALLGTWDAEDGPRLIATLRGERESLSVIVLSHGDSVAVAVDAMRAGRPTSSSAHLRPSG